MSFMKSWKDFSFFFHSLEILVSVLSVCVEAFGAETLSQVKVIDNYQGIAACKCQTFSYVA